MFVRQFRETRRPPSARTLLESHLPWGAFVDPEHRLMRTRDDGYLAGFVLEGYDLESMPAADLEVLMGRLNEAFKRLPPSWGAWLETRRDGEPRLRPGTFADPVAQWLEAAHCDGLNARGLWRTRAYLFVWQRPEAADESPLQQYLLTPTARNPMDRSQRLFDEGLQRWIGFLRVSCEALTPLVDDEFLTVLYEPLLDPPRPIKTPSPPTHLHTLSEVGVWPALDPMIGPHPRDRQYVGCLSIDHDFPPHTVMGLWRDLWRVPVPFRWMTRCIPVDTSGARGQLDQNQDDFETSRLRLGDLFWSVVRREQVHREDAHVDRQKSQVDTARDLMLSDEFRLHDLTITLVATHPTLETLDEKLLAIATPIQAAGCTVRRETYNTYEAFLSTLAGLPYVNTRKLRMTTMNLATLGPFHTPYQGPKDIPHLHGPVVTHGTTSTCMLARVSPYESDCADSLVIGPKGSGKSTFMGWVDFCQWLRYDRARVMGWSLGGSFRCVAKCLGGEHYNLYRDALQIQILRDLDVETELPWILTWLLNRLRDHAMVVDANVHSLLSSNLLELRRSRHPRTLGALMTFLADHRRHMESLATAQKKPELWKLVDVAREIIAVLKTFAQGGVYGRYVDAEVDRFDVSRVVSIDPAELIDIAEVYPALLEVIFHRAHQRRDGAPTRYVFDEAHHMLDTPTFVDFLAKDIPAWRRENTSGCFGTQALAQLEGKRISSLLFESSVVRYYLPNAHAMEEKSLKAYEGMDLHHDEILSHIAQAEAKRDIYMVRPDGRRRIDLRLFPVAQAICGANSIPAHALMDRVAAEYPAARFAVGWLRACGHDEAATQIDRAFDERGTDGATAHTLATMAADD